MENELRNKYIVGTDPYNTHIMQNTGIWINDNNIHNRTLKNYPATPVESYEIGTMNLRTEEMKLADEINSDPACVYSTKKYSSLNLKLKKLVKEYMQEAENNLYNPF